MGCAFAQQEATFRAQTRLVMIPFHANLRDLDRAGVVLLEDGKPREFSIFDIPSDAHRMPVELVLLFDANPKAGRLWDPAGAFPFVKQWNDAMSRALLTANGDIKISVYRCAGQKLYRSTAATGDPQALTKALRGILSPLPSSSEAGTVAELHLPPQRERITTTDRYTREYVTSRFLKAEDRGWTLEAAIGVLDQMALPGDRVSRVLAMFSEGIGVSGRDEL